MTADSQLGRHRGRTTALAGPYGPIAALRVDAGRPNGVTVLLVPGYTGSKEDFVPLLDDLADVGFTVLAIDLPGQYQSPGPDQPEAYLPEALGLLVAGLVRELASDGSRVLLVGHSYGGLVARAAVLAVAHPGDTPIAGLTLMASGPAKLPEGPRRIAIELGEPVLRVQGTVAAYTVREQVSAGAPGWADVPAELKDFLRTRFVASSAAGLLGMAAGLRSEPDRVDELATALDKADVPRLVVTGANDDAWSVPEQREMARRLGATFALVPGAAHSPNTENPAELLTVLKRTWLGWLSRLP
ncbi:MAG: alpha/beta fold hydrolase [Haloechinothrix sp.]